MQLPHRSTPGDEQRETVSVIVSAFERVGDREEGRYLLRATNGKGPWRLLGGSLPEGADPLEVAKRLVEIQVGGLTVGWDLKIELLGEASAAVEDQVFHGFFVRPVWEFHYLWAGGTVRWFAWDQIAQGTDIDEQTARLLHGVNDSGMVPKTWCQYLYRRYQGPWQAAFDAVPEGSDELVVNDVAPSHRAELGAALKRRLLAADSGGQRLLSRVGFAEHDSGVSMAFEWDRCRQGDHQGRAGRRLLEQAWASLEHVSDDDLINGGGLIP